MTAEQGSNENDDPTAESKADPIKGEAHEAGTEEVKTEEAGTAEAKAEEAKAEEAGAQDADATAEVVEAKAEAEEAETKTEEAETEEAKTEEAETEEEESEVAAAPKEDDGMRWYVVHTYSGYENKAKQALEDRIRAHSLDELFSEVLVPSEKVTEVRGGVKRTTTRKFFPGYMFVRMLLNDHSWHLVKNTPRVTGFVGGGKNPPPVPDDEVNRITNQIAEGTLKPAATVAFGKGETVRVIDGPFMNFNGIIEEVLPDKKRVKVTVSILGRSTPVEFAFAEIEKT